MSLKPTHETINLLSAVNEEGKVVEIALYIGEAYLNHVSGDDVAGLRQLKAVADGACEQENKALHEYQFSLADYPDDWSWNDVVEREFLPASDKPVITIAYAGYDDIVRDAALFFNGKRIKSIAHSEGESASELMTLAEGYINSLTNVVYQERYVELMDFGDEWTWDDVGDTLFSDDKPKSPSNMMTP